MRKYIIIVISLLLLFFLILIYFYKCSDITPDTINFQQSFKRIFPEKFILEAMYTSNLNMEKLPLIIRLKKHARRNIKDSITGFPNRTENYVIREENSIKNRIIVRLFFCRNKLIYIKILYQINNNKFAYDTQAALYDYFQNAMIKMEPVSDINTEIHSFDREGQHVDNNEK